MKKYLLCFYVTFFAASNVEAQACGPENHYIIAEREAFLFGDMYFCAGEKVFIKNETGSSIKILYANSSGENSLTNEIRTGGTSEALVNPGSGDIYAAVEKTEYYCVRYKNNNKCAEYGQKTTLTNYYSNGAKGTLTIGAAPSSY
jgi:hypothetical protein